VRLVLEAEVLVVEVVAPNPRLVWNHPYPSSAAQRSETPWYHRSAGAGARPQDRIWDLGSDQTISR